MKYFLAALVIAGMVLPFVVNIKGKTQRAVNVVGSTSIQPFAELLAEEFQKQNPGCSVQVEGGGSAQGIHTLAMGIADIGMCSRQLTPEEANLYQPIIIARDGLAVVVHPTNPIQNLTHDQIRQLFAGEITNWKQVGGPDRTVTLIMREEGSGTREAFVKLVMGHTHVSRKALVQESNGAVQELVRGDPSGIGYMSLGLVSRDLKMVNIDGKKPTAAGVMEGTYPLARPFLFVLKGQPSSDAQKFLDFVLSNQGQKLLESEGLVRAK